MPKPKPITITVEELGWLEDAIEVYRKSQEDPDAGEITASLLKRATETATPTKKGHTLYPITQAERDTVLSILGEWREMELEDNDA